MSASGPVARALLTLATLAITALANPVLAQRTTPYLPAHHWSMGAARRLESLGLIVPAVDHASSSFSESQIRTLFQSASQRAAGTRLETLARGYEQRFQEEFGDSLPQTDFALTRRSIAADGSIAKGQAAPGAGWFHGEDWTGAVLLPDCNTAGGAGDVGVLLGRHVAGRIAVVGDRDDVTLDESHVRLGLGPIAFWGGRRPIHFGPGEGLVLSGNTPINASGFQVEPFKLPGFLRHVGFVRFETLLSRFDQNGRRVEPWFWAARGSVQPARSFIIGINRGALFGGEGHPATLKNVAKMLVGAYGGNDGDFENQVVSLDARLVVVNQTQPIELYMEWGSDESSGGWQKAPGINFGALLPSVGKWTGMQVGVDFTTMFEKPECCNSFWYRNIFFRGAWANDNVALGHPLGGHGDEMALTLSADPLDARLRLRTRFALRDRGDENLYSPERQGHSTFLQGSMSLRLRSTDLDLSGVVEDGKGWRASSLRAGLRAFF